MLNLNLLDQYALFDRERIYMKKILSVLVIGLISSGIANANPEAIKIGTVEMQKALQSVEAGKKAKAQIDAGMAAACDTSKFETLNWISSSSMFIGPKPACPGKKETLCNALRQDVPRDVNAFQMLQQHEKSGEGTTTGQTNSTNPNTATTPSTNSTTNTTSTAPATTPVTPPTPAKK